MNSDRIKQIQELTAYHDSVSVQQALMQVWNECQQENNIELSALRKENEVLREFVWRVHTICSGIVMPTEKQVDEMLIKSKKLLNPWNQN